MVEPNEAKLERIIKRQRSQIRNLKEQVRALQVHRCPEIDRGERPPIQCSELLTLRRKIQVALDAWKAPQ